MARIKTKLKLDIKAFYNSKGSDYTWNPIYRKYS
jgi:hypothetical protein